MPAPHAGAQPPRRPVLAAVLAALTGLALAVTGLCAAAPAAAAATRAGGVFCNGPRDSCADAFGAWRDSEVTLVSSYLPSSTWSGIEVAPWWRDKWSGSRYRGQMLVSLPMLPDDRSQTLARGATGAYDWHFRRTARHLVEVGMGGAWIRPGWEFNGAWSSLGARGDPAAYAAYFRHIVQAMRSVPGAHFSFDWNVATGTHGWDTTAAYPGDDVVDAVGQDVYDMLWARPAATPEERWSALLAPDHGDYRYGLVFWADFAARHAKPLSYAEWGLVGVGSRMAHGGGGGDDPLFVTRMASWFAEHDTAFEVYFNTDAPDGSHLISTGRFPQAAQVYRTLFARPAVVVAPPPAAAPPPAPAPPVAPPAPRPVARRLAPRPAFPVRISHSRHRTKARALSGATLRGRVYVFATLPGARRMWFYLDDTGMKRKPFRIDKGAPFDLAGATGRNARPFATSRLKPGRHSLTVRATTRTGRPAVVRVTFVVRR